MSSTTQRERPAVGTRRVGYAAAVLVNAALLFAVNGWPGWEAVPFLTDDTTLVLGLVNASILVSLAANAVYLLHDPPWLRALGDVATTSVGLAAVVRIWQVFPFDFGDSTFDWPLVAHLLLGVAIVGSVIGILVGLTSFVRDVTTHHHPVTR
jgi:hypothetical protein